MGILSALLGGKKKTSTSQVKTSKPMPSKSSQTKSKPSTSSGSSTLTRLEQQTKQADAEIALLQAADRQFENDKDLDKRIAAYESVFHKKTHWNSFNYCIMPIARANDSEAIIDELLKHFQVLFADQASSRVYLTMVSDIITVQEQAKTLVGSVGGLNTEEKLEEYYTCCENLRDVLKDGLHILLHRCDWFEKAFPAI